MSESDDVSSGQPWGRATGLFFACLVTIAGIVRGFSPHEILFRAVIAGICAGLAVAVFLAILSWASRSA